VTQESQTIITLNGQTLVPLPSGALWWPAQETLIFADLHLEKGSALARHGSLLPPYDSAETLQRVEREMLAHKPARVIALGDSFHDQAGPDRLPERERDQLSRLTASTDWIWIEGNHDPAPHGPWGGSVAPEITLGALVFRHDAEPDRAAGEVSGHYHPKAAVMTRSRRFSARCFVTDGRRLIAPAFGAYAGGLDVFDEAISGLLERDFWAYLMAPARVLAVPRHRLVRGRLSP
jgi:DNA ligase-associated metallophosphoesterase